ncbi:MAG: hypothetical protein WBM13_13060 [Bacteroidia bacterium]
MTKEQIKTTLLEQLQQKKQVVLNDIIKDLKLPLIQLQWAAKVLEEEGFIASEKTEAGKVLNLAGKEAAVKPTPSEKPVKDAKADKPTVQPKTGRDTTKYVFEKSEPLPKGKCVLLVLKAYVRDRNPSLAQLKSDFPDSIVQRFGITALIPDAKALSSGGRDRYFMNEVLTTKDGKKLVVTSQWDAVRFSEFTKLAKKAGYTIKPAV